MTDTHNASKPVTEPPAVAATAAPLRGTVALVLPTLNLSASVVQTSTLPEAVAMQASAPSMAARRRSKLATVGLP